MNDISPGAVKALAALANAEEFSTFTDGAMAARQPDGQWIEITGDELAALTERALVSIPDEDDPETGLPAVLIVTNYGRTFLTRWQAAHGVRIVRAKKAKTT